MYPGATIYHVHWRYAIFFCFQGLILPRSCFTACYESKVHFTSFLLSSDVVSNGFHADEAVRDLRSSRVPSILRRPHGAGTPHLWSHAKCHGWPGERHIYPITRGTCSYPGYVGLVQWRSWLKLDVHWWGRGVRFCARLLAPGPDGKQGMGGDGRHAVIMIDNTLATLPDI